MTADELTAAVASHAEHETGGPAELVDVGSIYVKRGHYLRVTVKDAGRGGGPAVDVRPWITPSAYPEDTRPAKQRIRSRSKGRPQRTYRDEGYVGPRKGGAWLSPEAAVRLAELVYAAAELAAERATEDGAA
jgi:hypothetical protein